MQQEWPAEAYAIGSYIQNTIADRYFKDVYISKDAKVLDIGCGNGNYTKTILKKVPEGHVTGFDASFNMLKLADELKKDFPNFSTQHGSVLDMPYHHEFDFITSFWCLQWITDIRAAMLQIAKSLKPHGRFFIMIPAGTEPYITTFYALKASNKYPQLHDFKPPMDYNHFKNLPEKLKDLPFQSLKCNQITTSLTLPNLDTFRKFVDGIAFYQGQMSNDEVKEMNHAMVQYYDDYCQKHHQGVYVFDCGIWVLEGETCLDN